MIKLGLDELAALAHRMEGQDRAVTRAVLMIESALAYGHKLLFCGNGGSAAEAQHQAAEYVVKFRKVRPAFPAIALTTDSSIVTAAGNDFHFDEIFSRQVEALGAPGDILFAYTTSGNSKNILNAMDVAKRYGLKVILFTADLPEAHKACRLADIVLRVPSTSTARIQEMHLFLGHEIMRVLEERIVGTSIGSKP